MRLQWDEQAWQQYVDWQAADGKIVLKINALIKECQRTPFSGTGKPEALKGNLRGYWSRLITQEHRLVYRIEGDILLILQYRYHYGDR
ncbi:Txe/YoeB family addiction module toxin [Hymenobacter psychrotolerans]|uniref:Putative mRNA interferase YoeB n=1 Tax=Hymenobacter psychrotolerans DSM 18569 TaxID=1121959 RepID=A0A1M6YGR8_9BACT|nr:Txe/YoeB family addiction module toxin [Hymenobacter psychrotolerans]SHL17504.1 toxin YoeB [Hymenobacter psychrotolerans DSM 18569]